MAVKKTELYSSLWASCDALRGGMDASQYKDYVLTLLFMKYVTDKYKGQKYADIKVFDKAHDTNRDPDKRTGCKRMVCRFCGNTRPCLLLCRKYRSQKRSKRKQRGRNCNVNTG